MSNAGQIGSAVAGGVAGFFVGGPLGAVKGAALGLTAGTILFPTKLPDVSGPRLDDLSVTSSTYGTPIPLIYGRFRAGGNIIWSTDLIEIASTSRQGGKGGGGQNVTSYTYFANFAMAINGRPSDGLRKVWLNRKLIFDIDDSSSPSIVSDGGGRYTINAPSHFQIRFYDGTQTDADPVMESYEGAGNVPAYKGTSMLVFSGSAGMTGFPLADYGNSIPQIEVELQADNEIRLSGLLRDVSDRIGVPIAGDIWLDDIVDGYAISRQTSASAALIPLSLAYDFDLVEQAHSVHAVRRPRSLSATIPLDDLGAYAPNGTPPDIMPLVRKVEQTIPKEVHVSYPDPNFDYQPVTQTAVRQRTESELVRDVQVPVVMSENRARQVATRILWGEIGERVSVEIRLSSKWAGLRSGQLIALPIADGHLPFRITNTMIGQDGTIAIQLVYDDSAAYINGLEGAEATNPNLSVRASQPSTWMLMDTVLLQNSNSNDGFYWAVNSGANWRGATFERTLDGSTFDIITGTSIKAGIGDVADALPPSSADIWDEVNSITVVMRSSDFQLSSASELDVYNGANSFWLGGEDGQNGEIIQFRDATLIAENTYVLSGLLRGRLATENNMEHGSNEVFVLLESGVFDQSFGLGDWNTSWSYVAYSRYVDRDLVTPREFVNTGERAKPRSPVHLNGVRDSSNNLTISWQRRTRIPVTGLASLAPVGEAFEAYEVDILDGSDVVRTIQSQQAQIEYTAAQQASDGFTAGQLIDIVVYQMSDTRGRGHGAEGRV